jgi:hypothetical protein
VAVILDPATLTSAEMAQFGNFGRKHWWAILNSRPLLHTLMGRPEGDTQLRTLLSDARKGAGPGHVPMPPSKRIYEPVVHQDAGSQTRSIKGLDDFIFERGHHTGNSEWKWAYYATPLLISEQDIIENSAEGNDVVITKLQKWAMKVAIQKHMDKIAAHLVTSDGTGNQNRDMIGLAGHIPSDPSSATVGGWPLASKPDMRNISNANLNGTPSAGSRGDFFSNWHDDFTHVYLESRKPLFTGEGYQFIAAGQTLFENYERILTPRDYTQYPTKPGTGEKLKGRTGYYCLGFKDIEMIPDWNIAAGTAYWLCVPEFQFVTMRGHWLRTRPWQDHIFQWGRVTVLISGVQTIVPQLRAQVVIDGYTFT